MQYSNLEWKLHLNCTNKRLKSLTSTTKNGKIQIFATVENSRIKNIKFYGDFFGKNEDLSEVENLLKDVKYTREDVKEKLETVDIGEYFSKFTVDEVVEVIVE